MSTTIRHATTDLQPAESCGTVISGWWHGRTANKALLAGGMVGGVIYAVGDLLSGLLYDGYSFRDQAISELTAFGSPVRPLMVTVMIVHSLPLLAFAVGLWRISGRRTLRGIAMMLVGASVIGLPIHTIWAMSSRGVETGFNDTMHQALTAAWGVPIVVAVVLSAIAYRGWFRFYAVATIPALLGFGTAATMAMAGIDQNVTPWAGAFERVSCYGFFVWLAVLAVVVIPRRLGQDSRAARASRGTGPVA